MGRKCFVTYCNTGYRTCKEKYAVFSAPKDDILLSKWRKIIPRKDRTLQKTDFVCEKHFTAEDIIKEWSSGDVKIPLKYFRLKEDACPSIFPKCPKNLNVSKKSKRSLMKRGERLKKPKLCEKEKVESTETLGINSNSEQNLDSTLGINLKTEQILDSEDLNPQRTFNEIWSGNVRVPNEYWSFSKIFKNNKFVVFTKFSLYGNEIPIEEKQIFINEKLETKYFVLRKEYKNELNFPINIMDVSNLEDLLSIFDSMAICKGGTSTLQYPCDLCTKENNNTCADNYFHTWRHTNCSILINSNDFRQDSCLSCLSIILDIRAQKCRRKNEKVPTTKKFPDNVHIRKIEMSQGKKIRRLKKRVITIKQRLQNIKYN